MDAASLISQSPFGSLLNLPGVTADNLFSNVNPANYGGSNPFAVLQQRHVRGLWRQPIRCHRSFREPGCCEWHLGDHRCSEPAVSQASDGFGGARVATAELRCSRLHELG